MTQHNDNAPSAGASLAELEAADIGILEVENLAGEPLLFNGTPVRIHLYGPGSEKYNRAQAKLDAANQARALAGLRGKATKNAADAQREDIVAKLVECTQRIEGLTCTADELYRNQRLGYITMQVSRFVDDWANFQPASSTN